MTTTPRALFLRLATIAELAAVIHEDWRSPHTNAVQPIEAMGELRTLDDPYFAEDGRAVVGYFLANAKSWQGPTARAVKQEIWRRIRVYDRRHLRRTTTIVTVRDATA